jgi:hypothetical protein
MKINSEGTIKISASMTGNLNAEYSKNIMNVAKGKA